MARKEFGKMVLVLVLAAGFIFNYASKAQAVPSFARQTGMSCNDCHTVYPELTPVGRAFKLGGYVLSQSNKPYEYPPPIAAGAQVSYTEAKGLRNRIDPFDDSPTAKFNVPQMANLYYAGKIYSKIGAFAQILMRGWITASTLIIRISALQTIPRW